MLPGRGRLTVYDVQNLKDKEPIMMTAGNEPWIARAAERAGFHIFRCWGWTVDMEDMALTMPMMVKTLRRAAPDILLNPALPPFAVKMSDAEAIRVAATALMAGADIVLVLGVPPDRVAALTKQGIPCFAHVGWTPVLTTLIGGFRAVGKTSQEALKVYKDALAYQEAGASMITIELVPERVAAEIAKRLRIPVISVGSGSGCDGLELVASDVLGIGSRIPRHAKQYRDFSGEAVAAYKEFKAEVKSGAFPTKGNVITVSNEEFELFAEGLDRI
jgi:3-methyl-2-oxobutanoate hydroxymethyltransferase